MKRILLYLTLTTAFVAGIDLYIASHPIYAGKASRIDENYRMVVSAEERCPSADRYLVLGSSYVRSSFVTAENDCMYLKFIVNGMPLGDIVNIIRYLPDSTDFKYVVVGIGYDQANPVKSDSTVYRRHWSANRLERWFWTIPVARGRGLALDMVKEDVKCLFVSAKCLRQELPPPTREARIAGFQESIRSRYREYQPYTGSVSPKFSEGLMELREVSSARQIELLVYTAPIAPQLRELIGDPFLRDFYESIRSTGVSYVDMNDISFDWDVSFFSDATHVSPKGGRIVTEKIRGLLE